MAMTRKDRFRLKSQIVDALETEEWNFQRINLLLGEFGIEQLEGNNWNDPGLTDVIAEISDPDLSELYSVVLGVDMEEVEDVVESTSDGTDWKAGHTRLFISHSARHKEFVGQVANELAVFGIDGFVAHDSMTVSKPWQRQIEQHLRSMEAFVALLHPEFKSSAWCQQEIGWALGRRVPHFAVRIGDDPAAFIAIDQWDSGSGLDAKNLADLIYRRVAEMPGLGSSIIEGLFKSLTEAGDYYSAGAAASRIAELQSLSEENFKRLDEIWWSNNQLYGGVLPTNAMEPFYKNNGREWPPPKPIPAATQSNPWGSQSNGEPPF